MRIVVRGVQQVQRELGRIIGSIAKPQPILRAIGTVVDQWIDQNFLAQGAEQRWKPLAASTIFARRQGRGGGSPRVLMDRGKLRASHSFKVSGSMVQIGFPQGSTAEYHHAGSPPHTIPAKPGKTLAFPFPAFSRLSTGAMRTTFARTRTGSPHVGIVKAAAIRKAGMSSPKGKGAVQSVLFARQVHHPGLVARPLLPTTGLAEQLAREAVEAHIAAVVAKMQGATP